MSKPCQKHYIEEVPLYHHQSILVVDKNTGEVTTPNSRPFKSLPEGFEIHLPDAVFDKAYRVSRDFLLDNLNCFEHYAACKLIRRADAFTNSVQPLSDKIPVKELAGVLEVSRNKVRPVLKKLFDLGVYGKFEVAEEGKPYTKYWIINPYISFNGRLIRSDIRRLFDNTPIAVNLRKVLDKEIRRGLYN